MGNTLRIAVILAGGRSLRMGGADKANLKLYGRTLIEHAVQFCAENAVRVLISGPRDYGLGLLNITDNPEFPGGPAGGVLTVADWLSRQLPEVRGFFTVPVDGYRPPENLFSKLEEKQLSAVAADPGGVHPTYAFWVVESLNKAREEFKTGSSVSLHMLAEKTRAEHVRWNRRNVFRNINTAADLDAAENDQL